MFKVNLIRLAIIILAVTSAASGQVAPTNRQQTEGAQVHFDKGDSLRKAGQYAEAVEAYKRGLVLDPTSAHYYNELSLAYSLLEQNEEAAEAIKKALEVEPNDAHNHQRLGYLYVVLGKHGDALKAYSQAVRLDPKDAVAHAGLGNVYTRLKQYDEAIKAYQKSLELRPENGQSYFELSFVFIQAGKHEEAVKASQQAILYKAKDMSKAYNHLGYAHLLLGQHEAAATALRQSIKIDPGYMRAYNNLGETLFRLGRQEEAAEVLRHAISLKPGEFGPHMNLGRVYFAMQRYEEAAQELKQATRIDPNVIAAYAGLGQVSNHIGKYEEAAEAFTQIIQRKPQDADSFLNRAFSHLFLARGEAATVDARKYLELSGGHNERDQYMYVVAHFGYRQAGQEAEASRVLEEAVTKLRTKAWPYPVILYLRRELTVDALLAQAIDGDKKTEAQAYIGTDLLLSGRQEEAKTHLRWVEENGKKDFFEYVLAIAQLKRFEKTPQNNN